MTARSTAGAWRRGPLQRRARPAAGRAGPPPALWPCSASACCRRCQHNTSIDFTWPRTEFCIAKLSSFITWPSYEFCIAELSSFIIMSSYAIYTTNPFSYIIASNCDIYIAKPSLISQCPALRSISQNRPVTSPSGL